ncbi:hypothetical protein [Natronococcus sp. A-GB7]|uniref:hypothetical protein n=1 Tax=Natronococcus sp. A-GB7 TaxID=3037649 RepID=UPI00241E468E|nr:hypothetical protein [Natronococcus sp. A-GB7]MDG5821615.1 hypothetical protein [Natronococcus sp. A-GB7]
MGENKNNDVDKNMILTEAPKSIIITFKSNFIIFIPFAIVAFLIYGLRQMIDRYSWDITAIASQLFPWMFEQQYVIPPRGPLVIAIIAVFTVGILWMLAITCGASANYVLLYKGNNQRVLSSIQSGITSSLQVVVYLTLTLLLTVLGLLALVVPGVFILTRLFLGVPIIISENQPVIKSTRKSWQLTSGHEVTIAIILAIIVLSGITLWQIPIIGPILSFVVAGSLSIISSVVFYDMIQ